MRCTTAYITKIFLVLFAAIEVSKAAINDGLVIHYSFEGTGRNEASASFDLPPGSISFASGLSSRALVFSDGKAKTATVDFVPITGNSPRTISLWLNLETFHDQRRALGWGTVNNSGAFSSVVVNARGMIVFHCHNMDVYSDPGRIQLGKWHHVAVVFDGSLKNAQLYLDGEPIKTYYDGVGDTLNTTANTPLRLGHDSFLEAENDWNRGWHGKLDEIRIYNRALTATEVKDVYQDVTNPSGKILSVQKAIELQISSRAGEVYQIQTSTDLENWSDVGVAIPGTGKILDLYRLQIGQKEYYRVKVLAVP